MSAAEVPVYDRIGDHYHRGRREDPRIAAALRAALGDASPVLNVGAGTGSYEPRDRDAAVARSWWLHEYFPATARLVVSRETGWPRWLPCSAPWK